MTDSKGVFNPTLETLSDKVRKGEPIGFSEALAVIKYRENLRREREANSIVARLKRWLCEGKKKPNARN